MRLTLILLILVGLNHHTLLACKCDVKDEIEAHFEGTEVIVHGKVISKEFVDFGHSLTAKGLHLVCESYENDIEVLGFMDKEFLIKVELEVIETYKGQKLPKRISVYTARTSGACGYLKFEMGKEYQIYLSSTCYFNLKFKNANLNKSHYNGLWTNRCTRTREFDPAEDRELKKLMNG
ncbi:hypothetical protein [Flagellimonas sp.]|uniref:hypothetical protein n=1 Tax=Flagellimonas sp. TaxID=2058762 RepID=UPI003AB68C23